MCKQWRAISVKSIYLVKKPQLGLINPVGKIDTSVYPPDGIN
jgi:hypothetical protein